MMLRSLCSESSQELTTQYLLSASFSEILTSQYRVMRTIGIGGHSQVKLAYHRLTGTPVAVKIQQKGQEDSYIASEVSILKTVCHPYVIQLFQVMETVDQVYLIMEYVSGGELHERIKQAQRLCEDEAHSVFRQIVCAINYCHERGIVHRDLKADNILLDAHGNVKVIDFGLGTRYSVGQRLIDLCGAFVYRAPELFLEQPYDGPKVDVWSLGVLLYFMVTGTLPFTGETFMQLRQAILNPRYALPSYLSMSLQNLIILLLTKNPSKRPPLENIMWHPWLSQGEQESPSAAVEPLPKHLDPAILVAMCDLGYNLGDVCQSLLQRKFDEAMATYFMMRQQVCQGANLSAHLKPPVCPQILPTPPPADPSTSAPPLRRRASAPALLQTFTLSSDDKKTGTGAEEQPASLISPSASCQGEPPPQTKSPSLVLSLPWPQPLSPAISEAGRE
jgi:MAP/microtubule affinity-regulating kinase